MAITREQSYAAPDQIDAAGQNPTLAAVRKTVGGGSFTTIQEAMLEWKARRAAKAAPAREPVPASVAERLTEFGTELWAAAIELTQGRIAAEREALQAARAETEAARIEAAELADQLTSDLDALRERAADLATAADTAHTETETLRQALAAAEARAAEQERRSTELRSDLERARQEAVDARERAAALAGQLQAMEQQNAALLARLTPQEPTAAKPPGNKR